MGKYHKLSFVIIAMLFVIMISPLSAQDSLLMNYQGSLSNNIGEPLTGNFNITFRIYATSTGGTSLWNETYYSLPVSNGLINTVLGSRSTLMNSVLDGSDRYLGITIGGDTELLPRTLLTSSPRAAIAGKIIGDIQTSPGAMLINNYAGDSSIVFRSIPNLSSLRLFDPQSDPSGLSVLELSLSAFNGTTVQLFDPDPEPPRATMELRSGLNSGPSIKLFDALSESPKQLFELVATSGSGGTVLRTTDGGGK